MGEIFRWEICGQTNRGITFLQNVSWNTILGRYSLAKQPHVYTHHFLQRLSQEEKKELDEITAKRQKKGRNEEEAPAEEKTILHGTVNHCNPVLAWHSVISLSVAYY